MSSTLTVIIVVIVGGIVLSPLLFKQGTNIYNGRDPLAPFGNRVPYAASTSRQLSSLGWGILLLTMLCVIGIVSLGIYAPGILHALQHLFF